MTNLELQKEAVKVRKGIIDCVHAAKRICTLKR